MRLEEEWNKGEDWGSRKSGKRMRAGETKIAHLPRIMGKTDPMGGKKPSSPTI